MPNVAIAGSNCYHFGFLNANIMQQSITEKDIERFKELLTGEHSIFKRLFNTDELRIESGIISIWDLDSRNWFYLKNNFEWTDDSENEDILKLISSDSQAE